MSNERFDRLMKKNLESVRPAYQPRAWDRFQKRLPAVGFWPWLAHYGGWFLSGLMLTGWLITGYTLRENQQLIRELTNGNVPATRSQRPVTPSITAGNKPTHRIDTVYIIKQTIVEHRYAQNQISLPTNGKTGEPGDPAVEYVPGVKNKQTDRLIRQSDVHQDNLSDPAPTTTPVTNIQSGAIRNKVSNQPITGSSQSVPFQSVTSNPSTATRRQDQLPPAVDSINQVIKLATAAISTDSVLAAASPKPVPVPVDSVNQQKINAVTSTTTSKQSEPAAQRRPPFKLASLQPRIGIETVIMPEGAAGIGPAIELFPAENLGISLGVVASQFQSENHQGLKGYNQATGQAFDEQYRAYLPAQYDRIEDIAIRTSVISLPISLKYYVPLRPRWTLVVQAGSSFDLAAFQQVRYESYFQQEDQFHSFELPVNPRLFHNFTFGAGIQYQRDRISAQLSPYYLYDFRNIANTPAGSNVGIKAGLWLNLYK